jgi:hypothetical protein
MRGKGTRYKVNEHKDRIKQATIKIIFTIIIVGIVSTGLLFLFLDYQPKELKSKDEVESSTVEVILTTEATQKPTTKPTQKVTETSTQKPTEKPTENLTEPHTQASTTIPAEVQAMDTWLIDISNPDYNYIPQAVLITDTDRELIATVVMHEFGDCGYEACCLQAQAFRDAMVFSQASAETVYHSFQYDAYPWTKIPNQDCYDAVDYIFAGNAAVPHRVLCMYAPECCSSSWHESQNFVVEYKGVRFFDINV